MHMLEIFGIHNCGILQGAADPLPAENTWTHTIPNFKMSLLRQYVYGWGITACRFKARADIAPAEADGSAAERTRPE